MNENIIVEIIKSVSLIIVAAVPASLAFFFKRKKNNSEIDVELSNHHIFNRIDFNKSVIITRFSLENKGKEKVFKHILIKHMDIYKYHIELLLNKLEENECTDNDLYNDSLNTLNSIILDLSNFYKNSSEYTTVEKRVLEIVMNKYSLWNLEREQNFLLRVQEICSSNVYQGQKLKSYLLLDTFLYTINDTINDASKTLNQINGDLSGLKFKGVVI